MLLFLIRNGQNRKRVYGKRREKFLDKKIRTFLKHP